ncbi:hypothetical protein CEXT_470431 [Caerostris extrusa]|uniref:Uncharacterized protein n=1 Tax=Caerostris extrusa TaxID=172846 RepID=A0AAV4XVK5_CAEEX|nr:hypothetical protein CEXT_470431 [Caerostris extrusa]
MKEKGTSQALTSSKGVTVLEVTNNLLYDPYMKYQNRWRTSLKTDIPQSSRQQEYNSYLSGPRERSPNHQKLCTPSNRNLRMWRTSAHPSAMMGLCSGRSSFLIKDDSSAR